MVRYLVLDDVSCFVLRLGNSWRNVALLGILWRNVAFYEKYGCSSYWSEGKTRPPYIHFWLKIIQNIQR